MLISGGSVVVMITLMIIQVSSAQETTTRKCASEISCRKECKLLTDSDGCPFYCACPRTCETVDCRDGYICEMYTIRCLIAPCPTWPRCVPIKTTTPAISDSSTRKCASEISCSKECQKLTDSDGCPYCECPITCDNVDCRDGYICEMQVIPCLVEPCPSKPVCVLIS